MIKKIARTKWLYYTLQFTWGLLANIVGGLIFLVLCIFTRQKPEKYQNCWCIRVGKRWGGFSIGTFFVMDSVAGIHTKLHESGHALQNAVWGPLFIFVIAIPSALRYWYIMLTPNKKHAEYDSIWFEGQATKWGYEAYYDDWRFDFPC